MHKLIASALGAVLATTCPAIAAPDPWAPKPYVELEHPAWTKDAVLYQINTRHFTPEGTFRAAESHLPRLKKLGVDILWLMPIHPIGKENRKGTLGSPYSVQDYYAVNPEFGTQADLKHFVDAAHAQGFRVILDLVVNHTAWDHALARQHPDWYEKDWKGAFRPTPWWDWSDVIDLDWRQPGVRKHVGEAMEFWVREVGIDGYRADVAGYVPLDFWETERKRLEAIRPVFMLAEWKSSELTRRAFDAVYSWDWHVMIKQIAKGQADATTLYGYYAENESAWPAEAMRLTYIENHDSNAWEGTTAENFGPALPAFVALSFTGEGLSMIHNGQEVCNERRLAFFEKDRIDWSKANDCAMGSLLQSLIAFRKANPVLANGQWGARMVKVENDKPQQLFSWVRRDDRNKVLGLFNLSAKPVTAKLADALPAGTYTEFGSGKSVTIGAQDTVELPAWGYRLLATGGQ
ncbi:MAG: alpha-amlyase [Novosphingobium sp. 28-62-57]|uniref:alpha-amylase family glycosyl hydrolase n=1 Tax=unclassified Novosphingobium TaxID=2644732 RepID=UPI000BC97D70|nr:MULTISPECIES: alpha-amylase family glycosyl hydrolase [unclassified Novosphingobium]OYW47958.1 MAG: alpha-amlyase [Novosphingobium sp. 12-63-9]OYZ10852.1 MAG: alpha-amlyase [Novosphingobium sp. 28-62-57]OZA34139.1 MAG: alpha-amlyase [Novosphingobium sp. 17-62-9]HQS69083.1 alpha-amylase family glycosyl hydrolase [Novosphingobium sp.]